VRADDPKLKRIEPPKMTLADKLFLPQIAVGLGVTARHIAGVAFGNKAITMQYPEEQHVPSPNYRGVHRLNKDEQGRVKCVACMLCATACPAHCIDIIGATDLTSGIGHLASNQPRTSCTTAAVATRFTRASGINDFQARSISVS